MLQLKYRSIDELRDKSHFDKPTCDSLKKLPIQKLYEKFVMMDNEALRHNNLGNDEKAYAYSSRALQVYEAMSNKLDSVFMRSPDGKEFHRRLTNLMEEFDNIVSRLERGYSQSSYDIPISIEEMHDILSLQKMIGDFADEKEILKPQELVNLLESKGCHILVLDYRSDKTERINYKRNDLLILIQLDPKQILPGCLLKTIIQSVERTERPCLELISSYEYVVLLPDITEAEKPITFLSRNSKTRILFEALTTYNQYHPLKRKPVVLEKGFRGWALTYPCYVTCNDSIIQFPDEHAEFEKLLENAEKAAYVNVSYPDLTRQSGTSTTSTYNDSFPKTGLYPSGFAKTPVVSSKIKRSSIHSFEETSIYASEESLPYDAQIRKPSIDRSNKPFAAINEQNVKPPVERIIPIIDRSKKPPETDKVAIDRSQLPPKPSPSISEENQYYQNDFEKRSRRIPKTAVVAGARVASESHGSSGHQVMASTSEPRPAPLSHQANLEPQKPPIQPTSLHFFHTIYEKAHFSFVSNSAESSIVRKGYTGFINIGNTCFMNTTLQALFHTPNFVPLFLNKEAAKFINPNSKFGTKGVISGCFSALCDLYWSGKYSAIQPGYFLEIFARRVNSSLADRKQHDAQEFQIYLLDSLHEDMNKVTEKKAFEQNYTEKNLVQDAKQYMEHMELFSSSPINDIFTLTTVSTLKCESCETTSVRFEGLNQISVELPIGEVSVRTTLPECLDQFFGTTLLDSPWDCPNCRAKRKAKRSTRVWVLPEVLVIHMNRACEKNIGSFVKNEIDIEFEVSHFNMARYAHDKSPEQGQKKTIYQLYAIINHSGTLNSGHYTSYIRNANSSQEWLLFDDDKCSPMKPDPANLVTKNAFMLYYMRM